MTILLDAKGLPVRNPVADFVEERKAQFDADLVEAVKVVDLAKWRVFVLRWSDALHVSQAPPGGWDDEALLLPIIHSTRVAREDLNHMERVKSANWLTSNGRQLPNGLKLENGVFVGNVRQHVGPPIVGGRRT